MSRPSPEKTRNEDDASCRVPVDHASSASCFVTGNGCTDNQELPAGLPNLMDIGSPDDSADLFGSSVNTKNIVLVLDLDETLVHSKLQPCDNYDFTLQVFQLQVDNGIPIKSWFDDPADIELMELLRFLATLVDAKDVRPMISKNFSNNP
nr:unnamed protein product [Digitaria exilis]